MSIWMWSMKLRFQIGSNRAVGEPEGQNVPRRFLSQEVVDAEDLRLVERVVDEVVEFDGAGEVGAERFLHHHPGPIHQSGFLEHGDDGLGGLRRHRGSATGARPGRFLLRRVHRGGQPPGPVLCGTWVTRSAKCAHCSPVSLRLPKVSTASPANARELFVRSGSSSEWPPP